MVFKKASSTYDTLLLTMFLASLVTALVLLKIDAPYGRHKRKGWGPTIPTRLCWILMEAPAALGFLWFYFQGPNAGALVPTILLWMWELHYMHRAFIYPFQIRVKPGSREPLLVMLTGATYCCINAYLNATFISTYGEHLVKEDWMKDPRFILGLVIFHIGYYINKRADAMLRALRASSGESYKIPRGFLFDYVSMPNYLGEILSWCGFALASWSLAGLSFVVFSLANLVPRAVANHHWYQNQLKDYPKSRKAIFPGML